MIFSDLICIFAGGSHFYRHKNVKRGAYTSNIIGTVSNFLEKSGTVAQKKESKTTSKSIPAKI